MGRTLGTLVTITTYGMWLRGDTRGWVDDGRIMPPDPGIETMDRRRLKHPPFLFAVSDLWRLGEWIGESLLHRKAAKLFALTVQRWHCHFVVEPTKHEIADIVKCAKDAVRYGLRSGRPIWADGYDKRFCFDVASLHARIAYVERHNVELGFATRPWDFLKSP